MQKLISIFKALALQHNVKNYKWEIPKNCPIQIPDHLESNFERNIYLKDHLHEKLKKEGTSDLYYWIIKEWGGIKTFKKDELNHEKIKKFLSELNTSQLSKTSFERISSLSKVASFLAPSEYVIYDSRVIYSLNWLLLNYAPEQSFFVQPKGRNTQLAKYDMQTLIRLCGRAEQYHSLENAYYEYCKLVKFLSDEVYGKGAQPYLLEMLLFDIAPNFIVQDIEKRTSLKINNDLAI